MGTRGHPAATAGAHAPANARILVAAAHRVDAVIAIADHAAAAAGHAASPGSHAAGPGSPERR